MIRFSAVEAMEGGRDMAESRVLAQEFEEMGFDALHVSSGVYSSYCKGIVSSMYIDHAWIVDFAEEIKKLVAIPVVTVNRINEPKMANTIIKMGKADFIAMGRARSPIRNCQIKPKLVSTMKFVTVLVVFRVVFLIRQWKFPVWLTRQWDWNIRKI